MCVPVVSSLGHVASSSLCVAWLCHHSALALCHRWAVSPPRHHHVSSHVVVVAGPPHRHCCRVIVQCHHPCLATCCPVSE